MKYFLDTEFIEDGKTIDLISIAIVSEDDRSLYLQNTECNFHKASDWVWRNVFPHLLHFNLRGARSCHERKESYDSGLGTRTLTKCSDNADDPCPWRTRKEIAEAVKSFCAFEHADCKPEFWGYYADYDWVVFCQLFGTMMDLPKGYPMYCRDLKQWADVLDAGLPKPEIDVHHALHDAEQIKEWHAYLKSLPRP